MKSFRSFLVIVPFAIVGFAGCSSPAEEDVAAVDADLFARGSVPKAWDQHVVRPESDAVADRARKSCHFKKGAMPAATVGSELPVDVDIPIKNIVVLMQENRSFDSYFGHLAKFANRRDIASAPENTTNPESIANPNGPQHPYQHAKDLCLSDTNHEWYGAHTELNGGKMNGFFQANQNFTEEGQPKVKPELVNGERALWWYDERDIPFYYALASTFAIGDHYHSSVVGPTWPNRDYLYAASSRGVTTNVRPDATNLDFPAHDAVIFDELQRRRVDWVIFVDGALLVPRLGTFLTPTQLLVRYSGIHIEPMWRFYQRAKAGSLPDVSFIDANIHEDVDGNDEHPPGDIQNGQKFTSDVVHAMFKSPEWKQSAMFITYDENGGIYDHVVPPPACAPDDIRPDLQTDEDKEYGSAHRGDGFDQYGFRVPVTVVSPFVKKAYVSHKTFDHTSITRFIEAKFKIPALSNRDANADPMYDFFDFENPPFMTAPNIPEATIDTTRRAECQALYPK
jgi:phospholipase C